MKSLTLVVLTKNSGKNGRLARLLSWAESELAISEVKCYIDDKTRDNTYEVARSFNIKPKMITVKNIDSALAFCHAEENLKTDWALHLGDDELMGEWFSEDIEELMDSPYDVYSFPRYNIVNPEEGVHYEGPHCYIPDAPWYPDWAQRLFRPGHLEHKGVVHEGAIVVGRQAMARPHIFHFDFIDMSLEEREKRWQRYVKQGVVEASRQRGLPDDYYRRWSVPEDFEHSTAVCEEKL